MTTYYVDTPVYGQTINSGDTQQDRSFAYNTTVNSGGLQNVLSNADGTMVNTNGKQDVFGGANADNTNLNGPGYVAPGTFNIFDYTQIVEVNALALNTTLNNNSHQLVYGTADTTTINSGTQDADGTVVRTTINALGVQNVNGGSVTDTTINAKGVQNVSGTATHTMVAGGGTQHVLAGGTATHTTIASGATQSIDGSQSLHDIGTTPAGTATHTTIYGVQDVHGSAASTTIATGGQQYVFSGGSVTGTLINGGLLELAAGATASGATAFSGTGGTLKLDAKVATGVSSFGSTLGNFAVGDKLDLAGLAFGNAAAATLSGSVAAVLTVGNGTASESFKLSGQTASDFRVSRDSTGGTLVTRVGESPQKRTLNSETVSAHARTVDASDAATGSPITWASSDGQTTSPTGSDATAAAYGAGHSFVFNPNFGSVSVTDFYAHLGPAAGHDTISVPSSEFANFAAVLRDTSQGINGSLMITAANGDQLALPNMTSTSLKAHRADFTFHA